ncbi:Tm-1-like ATP-binding domain-containing protein [Verrucomicrobiaceae bacterium N1E253]|uniref:Tm-1-like ATP-binding domain-containing protein n=1 Tax=Oceaniferula marina TaxID=2748318 RepID=A0A851GCJ9_9BACT|nr:Tm-1-like ATP-binding domain-containing protein [Oceaniferula marina]NWK55293.1 Tm-1-like ATP-binding domain-containing protein [Oceaniferula marina]
MATIAVIGTLDSKGKEHTFLAEEIHTRGHKVLLIDLGTGGTPQITPDISRYEIAEAAGLDLQALIDQQDRGACMVAMSKAAPVLVSKLVSEGKIDGIISLGGGGGTALATAAMRALPIGFPKLMVSTLASGNTAHYVGTKDIVMMPSIVDVAGLNRISKMMFSRAAGAICGMVETKQNNDSEKPLIVASMFGNTTECINHAKPILEEAGYEVLVFAATGTGGRTMESLIESGMVSGVLDLTTTEWADEVVGATLSAGPERMDAMSKAQVPAVIAPGCVDMANFGERDSVPGQYADRQFYIHNPQVTLMRTSAEENAKIGRILAQKANANPAPTQILIPRKALSVINAEGKDFHDPDADKALFSAISEHAKVPVTFMDEEINSPAFAEAAAQTLLKLIQNTQSKA